MNYSVGDRVEIYNRPGEVKRVLDTWLVVMFDDGYTLDYVPEDLL